MVADDHEPAGQLVGDLGRDVGGHAPLAHRRIDVVDVLARVKALGHAQLDDPAQRRARFDLLGIEPVQSRVAVVGDDDARFGIVHGQPLAHVLERRVEEEVLLLQLVVGSLDLAQRSIDDAERQDGKRKVSRDGQHQGAYRDEAHLRQQRTQAGRDLCRADQRAGGVNLRLAGKRRPRQRLALLHHGRALLVDQPLDYGHGGRGDDLADGRELIGVVLPGRLGRVDVLRRP